jgi:hypothetical protein
MQLLIMKGKYLITTDRWFIAPDGVQYRAVWGEVKVLEDKNTLGISTNMRSTNWYVAVGSEENHVIIAGCQIHYAVKCEKMPNIGPAKDYLTEGGFKEYERPSHIYVPAREEGN